MADTPSRQSFWQTLPGILTGSAALISAVTGLIVVFNHSGSRTEPVQPSAVRDARSVSTPDPQPSDGAVRPVGAITIPLPSINQIKLGGGTAVVTILSARVESIGADRRSLTFRVRYMNAGKYPSNFWASLFRLIVDSVPRAPMNDLNEVVDADSAKEGDVVFEVPIAAQDVALLISSGDDKSRIPLKLP